MERAQALLPPTYKERNFPTSNFNIHSFYKLSETSKVAHIYIEGDGFAWHNKYQPSEDPTPKNPIGLKLALEDNAPTVFYLARPCQYSWSPQCSTTYWTEGRFSPEVIASFKEVLHTIKREHSITSLKLFGFSGGGVVAKSLAEEEEGVVSLTTVASPLDHKRWTQWHKVTPLRSSIPANLDPRKLMHVKQLHICGGRDSIVPCHLTQKAIVQLELPTSSYHKVKDSTHYCCWEKEWRELLRILEDNFP